MRIIFPLMNYNEALISLNLTTLSERRAHLCQVYIDRLRNENHSLHFLLPNGTSLYIITSSDLALAVSRVLLVELSTRKSLSLISSFSDLSCFIHDIVLWTYILVLYNFVHNSVIQPYIVYIAAISF